MKLLLLVNPKYLGWGNTFTLKSYLNALNLSFSDIEYHQVDTSKPSTLCPSEYDLCVSWVNSFFDLSEKMQSLFDTTPVAFIIYDFPLLYYMKDIKNNAQREKYWQKNNIFVYDNFFVSILKNLGFNNVTYLPLALELPSIDITKPVDKDIPVSFVGTLESSFVAHQLEDIQKKPQVNALFQSCLSEKIKESKTPYWKIFLSVLNQTVSFETIINNETLFYAYDKFSKLTAYEIRKYYISWLSKHIPVHVFTQNNIDSDQSKQLIIDKSCQNLSDLVSVYQRSQVNLNFNHTQLIDTYNQRFFNIPYLESQILSLNPSTETDLFNGFFTDAMFFDGPDDLLKKTTRLLDQSDRQTTTDFRAYIDSHHQYKSRWLTIFKACHLSIKEKTIND